MLLNCSGNFLEGLPSIMQSRLQIKGIIQENLHNLLLKFPFEIFILKELVSLNDHNSKNNIRAKILREKLK